MTAPVPSAPRLSGPAPDTLPPRPISPRNLYDQQSRNRRKTAFVIGLFLLLVLFLGYGVDRFVIGASPSMSLWDVSRFDPSRPARPRPVAFPVATVMALGVGTMSAWLGYRRGDKLVLASCRAVPLVPVDVKTRQLDNVVEEMAIASGLPKPTVYVVADPDPNAFATGRDPAHASIAVTQGLLAMMNREELQGVIAHEMSHIRNYDTRVMTVTAALLGAVLLLHDWSARSGPWQGRDSGDRKGIGAGQILLFILWIVLVVLAPLLGQLIAMSISRSREYLADASGTELTRNPLGLASALRKLQGATAPTHSISRGTAPLCICDPVVHALNDRKGFWADLLATHPPMAERIRILEVMAYAPLP
ncbi:MAG: M48 family metallopeptidase [Candidatus Methylomirabilis sp.]